MYSVLLEADACDRDRLIAELWGLGTKGVIERDLPGSRVELQAYFDTPVSDVTLGGAVWREEPARHWEAESRAMWQPIEVGQRFYVVPAWSQGVHPAGRLRLAIRPGMASGTGAHTTTQLCLEAMEQRVSPGGCVLDLGTGSGILAMAAKLLGAGRVVACDIDCDAVCSARENFHDAGVEVTLIVGSVRSIGRVVFDLVVANLNTVTLVSLAREIRRLGRVLILSGFPTGEVASIERAFGAARRRYQRNGWTCVVV